MTCVLIILGTLDIQNVCKCHQANSDGDSWHRARACPLVYASSQELEAFRSTPLHHAAVERPEDFEGDADWGATPRVVLQELWAGVGTEPPIVGQSWMPYVSDAI